MFVLDAAFYENRMYDRHGDHGNEDSLKGRHTYVKYAAEVCRCTAQYIGDDRRDSPGFKGHVFQFRDASFRYEEVVSDDGSAKWRNESAQ